MNTARSSVLILLLAISVPIARGQEPDKRTTFRIKYIAAGAVYLDGGRSAGLEQGQKLVVRRSGKTTLASGSGVVNASRIIAQLQVSSLADASAVCEIRLKNGDLEVGDMATVIEPDRSDFPPAEAESTRSYPVVISFTEDDPLETELRESMPRPPLREVNRARGRVGVEYSAIADRGTSSLNSKQAGVVVRMDMTRIGGTYWNFTGYWRGRWSSRSRSTEEATLNDLINRTYHLGLTYNNPNSHWTLGVGRLYVPWASSLSTLDGGYVGRLIGRITTVGAFVGTTPDPTSWNYNPDRKMAGTFVNFQGGDFDGFRFNSTTGFAATTLGWRGERRFLFFENSFFWKRWMSFYHTLEADAPRDIPAEDGTSTHVTAGISRSFATIRIQPWSRLSLDLSHNYFRDTPTFDPRLVGTGLVDNLLFEGINGGVRFELPKRITIYSSLGRSVKSGDAKFSWNQLYGVTLGEIWGTGIRADVRYSKFDSSFGSGSYRAVSFARYFGEDFRVEVQGGFQDFSSLFTARTRGHYVNATMDWLIGLHYYVEGGYTWQRGNQQNYDQWVMVFGRRF